MLSMELNHQAEMFRRWAAGGGVQMCPRVCLTMSSIMSDLRDQAAAIEGQPIPQYIRDALPPGVIDLQAERARRAAQQPRGAA